MFSGNTSQVSSDQLYVEDVFSTWLYTGNLSTQTITNGIDLAGKGGMIWLKNRTQAASHFLFDTSRGPFSLTTNNTLAAGDYTGYQSFTSSGFSIGATGSYNLTGDNYASWTFREAPKFFDVVAYTGTGANRTIAHNLGVAPGCILIKRTNTSGDWQVYHRGIADTEYMVLNSTAAKATGTTRWNSTTPTATEFTVGTDTTVNASGGTYVAYLFAHDTASDGIIQCGSYTGNGSATGPTISLGWEPQWVMVKNATTGGWNWGITDNMRGFVNSSSNVEAELYADLGNAEATGQRIDPLATGFQVSSTNGGYNTSGDTYIYIAIRRGPMKTPTLGTNVFQPIAYTANNIDNRLIDTGIVTDMVMARVRDATSSGSFYVADRLRGNSSLATALTDAENNDTDSYMTPTVLYGNSFSAMSGFGVGNDATRKLNYLTNTQVAHAFRRAPGFFDEVCYTGNGSVQSTKNTFFDPTNSGKNPFQLAIVKGRSGTTDWFVGYDFNNLSGCEGMILNKTDAATQYTSSTAPIWKDSSNYLNAISRTAPLNFSDSGATYVAYLFATCPGVSKVGSYTGNGSSQTINCGFAAGARFILIKRTDSTGDWYVWDTARGIVAGNDPHLSLNTIDAEVTTDDTIDTDSSGFVVNQVAATNVNVSSATYIYLAIA